MDGKLADVLKEAGLTRSESEVYITAIKHGPCKSGTLVKITGLQSSVVHRAIAALLSKGMLSYVISGKDRNYSAAPPQGLLSYLEEKSDRIKEILPSLEEAFSKTAENEQRVEMLSGKRAIFKALSELIIESKQGEEYCSFSLGQHHADPEVIDFYKLHDLARMRKKLLVRIMANRSYRELFEKEYSRQILRKLHCRYTDFTLPQGLVVFRKTVLLIMWSKDPIAVRIINHTFARQYHKFFHSIYDKERKTY